MSKRTQYFKNRKFNSNEQFNHWKNNWRNGVIRLIERILTKGNLSDLLGGNLTQVRHLPEVKKQLKSLRRISDGGILEVSEIRPINGDYELDLQEIIQPQYLLELNHLRVDVRSGLAQLESGFVTDATLSQWQRLLFRGGMSHSVARLSKNLAEKSGTWIVLPFSPYYFHTLVEDLPLLLAARQAVPEVEVLTSSSNPKWTFELLNFFNLDYETTDQNAYRIERYIAITAPRGISRYAIDLIRSSQGFGGKSTQTKSIFISRGEGLDRSDSALEVAIMEKLSKIGFESVNPAQLSIPEQAALFKSARVIVGIHGGGLSNMIWSSPGSKVVEIFNHPYRTHDFARLAAACDHKYSCIEIDLNVNYDNFANLIYEHLISEKW